MKRFQSNFAWKAILRTFNPDQAQNLKWNLKLGYLCDNLKIFIVLSKFDEIMNHFDDSLIG